MERRRIRLDHADGCDAAVEQLAAGSAKPGGRAEDRVAVLLAGVCEPPSGLVDVVQESVFP
jgi:hypothetical protein